MYIYLYRNALINNPGLNSKTNLVLSFKKKNPTHYFMQILKKYVKTVVKSILFYFYAFEIQAIQAGQ